MPDQRPIGNQDAYSETKRRSTFLIGDPSETHRRPTCLMGDPSETDMPDQRPIVTYMPDRRLTCLIGDRLWAIYVFLIYGSPMRHVGLQWVSNQACRSPMGLWSTCRSLIVFWWFSDRSPIIILFSWTHKNHLYSKDDIELYCLSHISVLDR